MEIRFTTPSLEEALSIAPILREADRREVCRTGSTPEQAIRQSFEMSSFVCMVYFDDLPGCLIGCGRTSILGNIGAPWFLTTEVMESLEAKKELIRHSPNFVSSFMQEYDSLSNYVDASYAKALRWLQWLGFKIGKPVAAPITGAKFCEITMERAKAWDS